ncbi:MAG: T9SS type A sorting domain-containing protein [Prolixibacteraceae bacterium]|nr:T9SS type A sorting domain-containing protein [Prolixibacteraceae bacterium]
MKTKYLFFLTAIFVLFLKIASAHSFADTTYVYSYDNSGNRNERVINLNKSAHIQNSSSSNEKEQIIEEKLSDLNIRIYPNPTQGALKIEIPELGDENARLVIYNNQGKLIIDKKVSKLVTGINLSKYPSGMYILKILIGQNSSEWKIIKD